MRFYLNYTENWGDVETTPNPNREVREISPFARAFSDNAIAVYVTVNGSDYCCDSNSIHRPEQGQNALVNFCKMPVEMCKEFKVAVSDCLEKAEKKAEKKAEEAKIASMLKEQKALLTRKSFSGIKAGMLYKDGDVVDVLDDY